MRNIFVGIVLVLALLGGAWWGAQRLLGVDAYRATLIAELESTTGMECAVEHMTLHFFPDAHLLIQGVALRDARFHARANTIRVDLDLAGLLQGQRRLPSIVLDSLEIDLADALVTPDANETAPDASADTVTEAPAVDWQVGVIDLPSIRLVRSGEAMADAVVKITDPLGAAARFSGSATLPGLSAQATATLDGGITREAGAFALSGRADLRQVDLAQSVNRPDLGSALLNAALEFSGSSPQDIAFKLAGDIVAAGAADVAGKVSGQAWWRAGEFIVNDFTWDSPGLRAVADATRKPDGELAVELTEARASKTGLALLLSASAPEGLRIEARDGAQLAVTDLLVGRTAEGTLRWVRGKAELSGLDLTLPPPGAQRLEKIAAKAHLEEGTLVLELESASLGGFNVAGRVTPTGQSGATFQLAAKGDLSNPLLSAQLPAAVAQGAKGALELKRLAGTWKPGGGLPTDLLLEGSLNNATLPLKTDAFNDTFNALNITFTSDGKAIQAKAVAEATTLGKVAFDGKFDTVAQALDGTTTFSADRLAAAFAPPGLAATMTQALLAAYRDATYTVALRLPKDAKSPGSFTLEKSAAPTAKVGLVLLTDVKKGGTTVGEMSLVATLPFAPAAAALPWPAQGDGQAAISFQRSSVGRFSATADLAKAALTIPPYLAKASGAPLKVTLDGAAGEAWALERVGIDLLGQPITLVPQGDGFATEDLALDLGRLVSLFPAGSEANGTLMGRVVTQPFSAKLTLDEVRMRTPGGIAIERIDGDVDYAPTAITGSNLQVAAYGSDATIDGKIQDGRWQATLRGKRLDLNTLSALREAQTTPAPRPGSEEYAASNASLGSVATGQVDIALDEVLFRRATLANVTTTLRLAPEETTLDNISCAPAGGSATGRVSIRTPGGGRSGTLTTTLNLQDVDLRLLDEISTSEPRGMSGPCSGTIDLSVPYGPTAVPIMGVNGEVTLAARNGSFGKAGASGIVLTALRTTELAQLQIPSLRDRGLSFTSANAHVVCREGVVTLEEFNLAERTHTMNADGVIDFPGDTMDVTLRVQLLQTVRDVVGLIPVLDRIAQAGGIYVKFKGSPSDPKVSSARIRPLQEIRQQGGGLVNDVKKLFQR